MRIKYLISTVLAAGFLSIGLNAAENAGKPAASPAKYRAIEKVKIETPDITIRKTLESATAIARNSNLPGRGVRAEGPKGKPSFVSMYWSASIPGRISYTFHNTDLDAITIGRSKKPGTLFLAGMMVNSAGMTTNLPPYYIVHFPGVSGDLAYNKDLLPIGESFKDIDEIIQTLQNRLIIDLGLDLRRKLCPCGPVEFKLIPTLNLYNRPGNPFGYSCDLSLYASYKKLPGAGGCAKRGCKEGSSISLKVDPVTGEFMVQDYWDGLVYAQYAVGLKPVPKGKDKRAEAAGHLKMAFLMFDSLFGDAAKPGNKYREVLRDNTEPGLNSRSGLNSEKMEEKEFRRLDREIAGERLNSLQEAVRLQPWSAMAHAALGLLLSQDCAREMPPGKGNCEKGILSLLKARELSPGLAFPAYVLVNRGGLPTFPKKLKPLLKEDPAALCDKFKDSAPAWDWAFYSTCGFRGIKPGRWERAEEDIQRAQGIPIIRPGDILLGYLEMELSGK